MTRKRRYLISAAVLAVCVCIAVGVPAMLPPRPGVTTENYRQIKTGMMKAEVMKILGCEAHYGPNESPPRIGLGSTMGLHTIETRGHVWEAENCRIYVVFDDKGKVTGFSGPGEYNELPESIPDKLRRWLRLPK